MKIKVACLLLWPSGVQLTNGESGTGVFQYKLIISPSPLPGARSYSLYAILETILVAQGDPCWKKKKKQDQKRQWNSLPALVGHPMALAWAPTPAQTTGGPERPL